MDKVSVKLNRDNIKQWLKSQEMMNMLQGRADAALCNLKGCTTTQYVGLSRFNVAIETEDRDNIETNAIIKALR